MHMGLLNKMFKELPQQEKKNISTLIYRSEIELHMEGRLKVKSTFLGLSGNCVKQRFHYGITL